MTRFCLSMLLLVALAAPALAADASLFDPVRFSMGAQAGLSWHTARPAENDMEPTVAVVPSWSLGTLPALVVPVKVGVQSQQFALEPKLSVLAYDTPGAQVFVQGGLGFYSDLDSDGGPEFRHEPVLAAVIVVPLGGNWAVAGNATMRTRSEQRTVSAMLSYLIGGER